MNFIFNIGLDVNATETVAAHVALQIVGANDFRVVKHAVVQSDTEPTLVVEVECYDFPALAWMKMGQIARDLRQDCIAIYNPSKRVGALAGDRAAKWGPFNAEFFFLLDGTRLSQRGQQAA